MCERLRILLKKIWLKKTSFGAQETSKGMIFKEINDLDESEISVQITPFDLSWAPKREFFHQIFFKRSLRGLQSLKNPRLCRFGWVWYTFHHFCPKIDHISYLALSVKITPFDLSWGPKLDFFHQNFFKRCVRGLEIF